MRVCLGSEKVTPPLVVAIGKSKGSCFEVFQNNYTLHVNQTCPPKKAFQRIQKERKKILSDNIIKKIGRAHV